AGPPRQRDVLWLNDDLFYADLSQAKLAKLIPEEIGKCFGLEDIKAALDYSFRRSAQDVQEYVEANFDLCLACTVSEETPKKVEGSPPSEPQEPKPSFNGGEPLDKPDESSDVPDTPPGDVGTEPPVKKKAPPRHPPTSPPNPNKPPAKPRGLPGGSSDNQAIAWRAREIIKHVERWLGFEPVDRESERLGYDIESRVPGTERLRFIEVKGRSAGSPTPRITVTRNEIIYSLNNPDKFILAIVEFNEDTSDNDCKVQVDYLREPFLCKPGCKPDDNVVSVSYDLGRLRVREGAEMEDTKRMTFNDERIILRKNLHGELTDRTYHCTLNISHRDLE
ncbi:MAG: DUF3883 domain-containing protein, partial [Synechococcus sp. SB0673_bin_10]|nr:DUF3883 domain-containing protein [Synechococcus sp. SB0673_bin_10]